MLKLRMGGTEGVEAKREEAWRIVPSPPKVVMRSILEEGVEVRGEGKVEMGKGRWGEREVARGGSKRREREG